MHCAIQQFCSQWSLHKRKREKHLDIHVPGDQKGGADEISAHREKHNFHHGLTDKKYFNANVFNIRVDILK